MQTTTSYLFSEDRLLTFSWRRVAYLFIAITGLLIKEVSTSYYRPFIYYYGIQDWGLADTAGNLLGIIPLIFTFLFIAHADRRQGLFWIATQPIGMILYEFTQPLFPWGTFDPMDIVATVIGGVIALILFLAVDFFFRSESKQAEPYPAGKTESKTTCS